MNKKLFRPVDIKDFMSDFQHDTLESVYAELKNYESALNTIGQNIRELADVAIRARARYEEAKNKTLIHLYAEETGNETSKPFKRTEAQRQAIYRSTHSELRLAAYLAENNLKSEQDLLKITLAQITSCQSRSRILEAETRLSK